MLFAPLPSSAGLSQYLPLLSRRRGVEWGPKALPKTSSKHGDTIDIEITGIGTLSNPVVREGQ